MTSVIEQFGAWGVFLLMVPESACIPLPSEVTLLFSGFAVARGWMSLPLAALAATGGNVVGSLLAYWLGASRVLERVPVARQAIERWGELIDRRGSRAVFTARLVPLARTFVSLPAGARRIPLGRFAALTAAGCAVWALGFILAGVAASSAWAAFDSIAGRVLLGLGLLVLILSLKRTRDSGR